MEDTAARAVGLRVYGSGSGSIMTRGDDAGDVGEAGEVGKAAARAVARVRAIAIVMVRVRVWGEGGEAVRAAARVVARAVVRVVARVVVVVAVVARVVSARRGWLRWWW